MNSKVSIILPVYNGEYFIQQTLDSVFTQTHKNRELIIINDCSTDQSEKIIDPYLNDPRVIYIKNEKNLNIVGSRNIGLSGAKGYYICFLDQDDVLHPDKLQSQMNFLEEHKEYGLVGCGTVFINEDGIQISTQKPRITDEDIRKHITLSNQFSCGSVMFRKIVSDQIGLLDDDYKRSDDYDYRLRIGKQSKMANLSDYLFYYRLHNTNTTNQGSNLKDMKHKTLKLVLKHGRHYPNYFLAIMANLANIILPEKLFTFFIDLYKGKRSS